MAVADLLRFAPVRGTRPLTPEEEEEERRRRASMEPAVAQLPGPAPIETEDAAVAQPAQEPQQQLPGPAPVELIAPPSYNPPLVGPVDTLRRAAYPAATPPQSYGFSESLPDMPTWLTEGAQRLGKLPLSIIDPSSPTIGDLVSSIAGGAGAALEKIGQGYNVIGGAQGLLGIRPPGVRGVSPEQVSREAQEGVLDRWRREIEKNPNDPLALPRALAGFEEARREEFPGEKMLTQGMMDPLNVLPTDLGIRGLMAAGRSSMARDVASATAKVAARAGETVGDTVRAASDSRAGKWLASEEGGIRIGGRPTQKLRETMRNLEQAFKSADIDTPEGMARAEELGRRAEWLTELDQQAGEIQSELDGLRAMAAESPLNPLLTRIGIKAGDEVPEYLSASQARRALGEGRQLKPGMRDARGRYLTDYVIDETADELGMSTTEARAELQRLRTNRDRIASLEGDAKYLDQQALEGKPPVAAPPETTAATVASTGAAVPPATSAVEPPVKTRVIAEVPKRDLSGRPSAKYAGESSTRSFEGTMVGDENSPGGQWFVYQHGEERRSGTGAWVAERMGVEPGTPGARPYFRNRQEALAHAREQARLTSPAAELPTTPLGEGGTPPVETPVTPEARTWITPEMRAAGRQALRIPSAADNPEYIQYLRSLDSDQLAVEDQLQRRLYDSGAQNAITDIMQENRSRKTSAIAGVIDSEAVADGYVRVYRGGNADGIGQSGTADSSGALYSNDFRTAMAFAENAGSGGTVRWIDISQSDFDRFHLEQGTVRLPRNYDARAKSTPVTPEAPAAPDAQGMLASGRQRNADLEQSYKDAFHNRNIADRNSYFRNVGEADPFPGFRSEEEFRYSQLVEQRRLLLEAGYSPAEISQLSKSVPLPGEGGLTQEALNLIDSVDAGGDLPPIGRDIDRIARENGIKLPDRNASDPSALVDALRAKRGDAALTEAPSASAASGGVPPSGTPNRRTPFVAPPELPPLQPVANPRPPARTMAELPPIEPGHGRIIHMTNSVSAEQIAQTGLKYKGQISGTTHLLGRDAEEMRQAMRYNYEGKNLDTAVILEMTDAEYRGHDRLTGNYRVVPPDRIVGIVRTDDPGLAEYGAGRRTPSAPAASGGVPPAGPGAASQAVLPGPAAADDVPAGTGAAGDAALPGPAPLDESVPPAGSAASGEGAPPPSGEAALPGPAAAEAPEGGIPRQVHVSLGESPQTDPELQKRLQAVDIVYDRRRNTREALDRATARVASADSVDKAMTEYLAAAPEQMSDDDNFFGIAILRELGRDFRAALDAGDDALAGQVFQKYMLVDERLSMQGTEHGRMVQALSAIDLGPEGMVRKARRTLEGAVEKAAPPERRRIARNLKDVAEQGQQERKARQVTESDAKERRLEQQLEETEGKMDAIRTPVPESGAAGASSPAAPKVPAERARPSYIPKDAVHVDDFLRAMKEDLGLSAPGRRGALRSSRADAVEWLTKEEQDGFRARVEAVKALPPGAERDVAASEFMKALEAETAYRKLQAQVNAGGFKSAEPAKSKAVRRDMSNAITRLAYYAGNEARKPGVPPDPNSVAAIIAELKTYMNATGWVMPYEESRAYIAAGDAIGHLPKAQRPAAAQALAEKMRDKYLPMLKQRKDDYTEAMRRVGLVQKVIDDLSGLEKPGVLRPEHRDAVKALTERVRRIGRQSHYLLSMQEWEQLTGGIESVKMQQPGSTQLELTRKLTGLVTDLEGKINERKAILDAGDRTSKTIGNALRSLAGEKPPRGAPPLSPEDERTLKQLIRIGDQIGYVLPDDIRESVVVLAQRLNAATNPQERATLLGELRRRLIDVVAPDMRERAVNYELTRKLTGDAPPAETLVAGQRLKTPVPPEVAAIQDARQRAALLRYMIDDEARVARPRIEDEYQRNVTRIRQTLREGNLTLPADVARDVMDQTEHARTLTPGSPEQYLAFQRIQRQIHELVPSSEWQPLMTALNMPRTFVAMWDFSAPFVQGRRGLFSNPKLWAEANGEMLRAFRDHDVAEQIDAAIHTRYALDQWGNRHNTADIAEKAGLGLGALDAGAPMSQRQEAFVTRAIGGQAPRRFLGPEASQDAYVTFLNKFRSDKFDQMYMAFANTGHPLSEQETKQLAQWINAWTGWGNLPKNRFGDGVLFAGNLAFFSIRNTLSLVEAPVRAGLATVAGAPVVGPVARGVARGTGRVMEAVPGLRNLPSPEGLLPETRIARAIMKDAWAYYTVAGSMLYMMYLAQDQLPGLRVSFDPDSTEGFGAHWGPLHFTPFGQDVALPRMMARLAEGGRTTSTGTERPETAAETLEQTYRNRANPLIGTGWSLLTGFDSQGLPTSGPAPAGGKLYDLERATGLPVRDTANKWLGDYAATLNLMLNNTPMILGNIASAGANGLGVLGSTAAVGLQAWGAPLNVYESLGTAEDRAAEQMFPEVWAAAQQAAKAKGAEDGKTYRAFDFLNDVQRRKVMDSPEVQDNLESFSTGRQASKQDQRATASKLYESAASKLGADLEAMLEKPERTGQRRREDIQDYKKSMYDLAQATIYNPVVTEGKVERDRPNREDQLAQAYWNAPMPVDELTGEMDFKARDTERKRILDEARTAGIDPNYILTVWRNRRFSSDKVKAAVEGYEQDMESLKPYFELKETYVQRYHLEDTMRKLSLASTTEQQKKRLRDTGPYKAYAAQLLTVKRAWLKRNPDKYKIAKKWGINVPDPNAR